MADREPTGNPEIYDYDPDYKRPLGFRRTVFRGSVRYEANTMGKHDDNVMVDGFGRAVNEDLYWRNTGLSAAAIARIKEYHRTHPVQADGTRLKEVDNGQA